MRRILFTLLALAFIAASCNKIDNKAVASYPVRINLGTYAMWTTYGVSGIGAYRIFNRSKQLPSNFAYNANTYTGYGGVLLINGLDLESGDTNYPLAFDDACPVEDRPDVNLTVDASNFDAVCPKCGSRFNVITGAGGPISGKALEQKVGLRTYKVRKSTNGGYIITSY
jgi:nitrite reductase/ring-hydroxylating ferredoxin subunit